MLTHTREGSTGVALAAIGPIARVPPRGLTFGAKALRVRERVSQVGVPEPLPDDPAVDERTSAQEQVCEGALILVVPLMVVLDAHGLPDSIDRRKADASMPSVLHWLSRIQRLGCVDADQANRSHPSEDNGVAIYDPLNRIEVLRVEADRKGQPEPSEQGA